MGQRHLPPPADDHPDRGGGLIGAAPEITTVGHGARPVEGLLAVLTEAQVSVVVDVRRYPASRRHPQFGREALSETLAGAGIGYEWWGEPLGGRRTASAHSRHPALRHPAFAGYADHMDSAEFRTAVTTLLGRAGAERFAVMCAETLWWRCHRKLIADALTMRGAPVRHLLQPGHSQPHPVSPAARPDPAGWPVYDVPDPSAG